MVSKKKEKNSMADKVFLNFVESEIEHFRYSGDKARFFGAKYLSGMYYRQAELFESWIDSYIKQQKKNEE